MRECAYAFLRPRERVNESVLLLKLNRQESDRGVEASEVLSGLVCIPVLQHTWERIRTFAPAAADPSSRSYKPSLSTTNYSLIRNGFSFSLPFHILVLASCHVKLRGSAMTPSQHGSCRKLQPFKLSHRPVSQSVSELVFQQERRREKEQVICLRQKDCDGQKKNSNLLSGGSEGFSDRLGLLAGPHCGPVFPLVLRAPRIRVRIEPLDEWELKEEHSAFIVSISVIPS